MDRISALCDYEFCKFALMLDRKTANLAQLGNPAGKRLVDTGVPSVLGQMKAIERSPKRR